MTKYHINAKGVVAPCRATKGNCPFGGEESHYDSEAEGQKAADKKNSTEFGSIPMSKHFGFTEQIDLAEQMTKHAVASLDGHEMVSMELHEVERQRRLFEQDGGAEELIKILDEDDDDFMVHQTIISYFPTSDDNGDIDERKEKNARLATKNIVKMHELGMKTNDEYKVKEKLEDFNVELTTKDVIENADLSGRKPSKEAVAQAKRLFESYASNEKFYRYGRDEYGARDRFERNEGQTLDTSKSAQKAQRLAFELAKGYYENKILYNTLGDNRERIVSKLSSEFEKAFSK